MKRLFPILLALIASAGYAQENQAKPGIAVGFELDALPYLTGGYYASVWAGRKHLRY